MEMMGMALTGNIFKVFYFLITRITVASGWTLVFKIATGGNGSVNNLYNNLSTLNVGDADAQNLGQPFRKHFKSDVVDLWSTQGIVQVRLGVYKNCSEVAYFLFNGTGSNKMTWFDYSRLLSSSYTDLKNSNPAAFSIPGFLYRKFLMTAVWGHCPGDLYWLRVVDTNSTDFCDYEKKHNASRPSVLYSPHSIRSNFTADKDNILADSLAVFVKFSTDVVTTATTPDLSRCGLMTNEITTSILVNTAITTSSLVNNGITTSSLVNNGITTSILVNNEITTSSMVNSEISTSALVNITIWTSTLTSAYCICKSCPNAYITEAELIEMIANLKKELTIDKKNTSRYKRLHTSKYDDRRSSKCLGAVGISVLIGVAGLFVAIDLANYQRHLAIHRRVRNS